jgi:hypothetical protein
MCMDGISHLVMEDEVIRSMMSRPGLDLVHHQVVMALYSMDANGNLQEFRDVLPTYLGMDWARCEGILDAVAKAGIIRRTASGIELTYRPDTSGIHSECGCAV